MTGFGANVRLQHIIGQNTLVVQTHAQKQKGHISSQTEWFGPDSKLEPGFKGSRGVASGFLVSLCKTGVTELCFLRK